MEQFEDTLVKILLFAAVISAVIGLTEKHNNIFDTLIEPMVILLVLVVNAIISVKQTLNAEEAIQALKEYEPQVAKVIRSPHRGVKPIKARELVCGDIVEISVGDRVPADLRVCAVYSSVLCADQSILTGESLNVIKHNDIINIKQPVNQDKTNILFSGTNIVAGRARACVIATGTRTEIGKIREHLLNTESARTPLQIKLDEFGNQLSFIITIICVLVWVVNIHHFDDAFHGGSWVRGAVYYFKIAISLAVAAIPEGLPAVITTCLAIGTRRMAKKAAIVRTLRSVETLGCTSVICSDKTGTITTNQMAVQRIFLLGGGEAGGQLRGEAGGCGCECGDAGGDPCGGGGCSKGGLDLRDGASGQSRGVTSRVDSHGDAQGDCRTNPSGGHCDCGEAGGHLRGALTQFSLSGTTYDYRDGELLNLNFINNNKYNLINKFLTYCCVLCNDATLTVENNSIHRLGEATEAALLVLAEKLNVLKLDRRNLDLDTNIKLVYNEVYNRFKKLFTLEFSRDRKSMSVYCEDLNNRDKSYLFAKGAPEEIISRCKYVYNNDVKVVFSEEEKSKFLNSLNNACVGQDTFRCIGLAVNDAPPALDEIKSTKAEDFKNIESDMIFLGVVGMIDPPRAQVLDAINKCGEAGIRVIVITGDNKDTAEAICHRVGIFKAGDDLKNISFSSKEFDNFSHKEKLEACARAKLFSRVEPKHKSEIVGCLQELGEVTAMTGDGVNDAPALKKAEIGVAMGSGTAVAKSAADIVLADDNFSTIVSAVFEGRAIFNNAVQFISYLVSSNIGEVVCILITSLLGLPECLIPVQLLWVNLITDGLPATALGFNPPPDNIMKYPPRDPKAPMIGRWQMFRYFSIGVYIGLATIAGSLWWYLFDPTGPLLTFKHLIYHQHCSPTDPMFSGIDCQIFNNYIPMTISLSILVFTEMFNACNSMSDTESILVFPPWRNGYLILAITSSILIHLGTLYFSITQNLFDVIMLNALQWKVVLILSFPVIFLDEILKFFYRMMLSKKCKDKLA